jgi:hypothetical protein
MGGLMKVDNASNSASLSIQNNTKVSIDNAAKTVQTVAKKDFAGADRLAHDSNFDN